MTFYVGQKVVAIEDAASSFCDYNITKGELYTIRAIFENPAPPNIVLVALQEQKPVPHFQGGEHGWAMSKFRPLIETDISVFRAILANPKKELETA